MSYGPYNHVPEAIEKGKQKAMQVGAAVTAPVRAGAQRLQTGAQNNNPNYNMLAPSTGGPSKTRGAIDSTARAAIGNIRENVAPAIKRGYDSTVDFASRNIIEPLATADYSGAQDVIRAGASPRAGLGVTSPDRKPSIADGYQVVDESPQQIRVQRGPGLDPIFRGTVGRDGDAAYALDQGRKANAIRQQTIDADVRRQNQGRAKIQREVDRLDKQGGSKFDQVIDRQLANIDELQNGTYNNRDGQRLYRATQALGGVSGDLTSRANNENVGDASRYASDSSAYRNADDNALLADRNRISQQRADDTARYQQAAAQARQTGDATDLFSSISSDVAGFLEQQDEEGLRQYLQIRGGTLKGTPFEDQFLDMVEGMNFAGGLVENFNNGGVVEQYAQGGPVLPQAIPGEPAGPNPQLMNQYQQYAVSAQEMGLTAIPFEKFAGLQGSSGQTIENFEDGGAIPGQPSGGRMVIDSDPNAPIDSIPAEIDGERPAALDSGEFIFPTDVVLYFGTDKLNKMIEKARDTGEETNGPEQSTAFQLGAQ